MQVFLEHLYVNRELHRAMFATVCEKYNLTITEVMILLLLHQEKIDVAKEIATKFKIAKSHLSSSIRDLEDKGYIYGEYVGKDHRTIHLRLCESASEIASECSMIYENFLEILVKDFSEEEKEQTINYLMRMIENANTFLKE